jgi:hypothetical protein
MTGGLDGGGARWPRASIGPDRIGDHPETPPSRLACAQARRLGVGA